MPRPRNRPSLTVCRRSVAAPILYCLLASVLAGTIVYRCGLERWTPVKREPAFTAVVYVVEHPTVSSFLQAREERGGKTARSSDSGAKIDSRISFTSSNNDRQLAARAATALAESYVGQRRTLWHHDTESICARARRDVETARRHLAAWQSELETLDRWSGKDSAKPPTMSRPKAVENPRWLALNRELFELRRRRDDLLLKRTPEHPAVRDVTRRVETIESQLAVTPRQIPSSQPGGIQLPPHLAAVGTTAPATGKANDGKRRAILAAIADAQRTYESAQRQEQRATQILAAGLALNIEPASLIYNPPRIDYGWWRLVATALMTGVVIGLGAGWLALAVRIELPEASVAQVEADLGKPVVGVIAALNPVPVAARVRHQKRLRRMSIEIALFLLAAAPLLAIVGVLGI